MPGIDERLGYPVVIASDARAPLQAWLAGRRAPRIIALCDANPAVMRVANRLLRGWPTRIKQIAIPLGEARKTLRTYERIVETLLRSGADRQTLVLGFGGGVASDLFGFAAATTMRGLSFAHVATSCVAMVDAAIGGKTGANLPLGKNLVGVFSDPVAVFAHVDALQTLPLRALREGLAEVLKAAIIDGGAFFDGLEELAAFPFSAWPWVDIIARAAQTKINLVAADRTEQGVRERLNLGHTFAHGIETAGGYRITHGAAVALGLRAAGAVACKLRRFPQAQYLRVQALLLLLGMPLQTSLDTDAIMLAMRSDKKRRGEHLRFVLPRAIGNVGYGVRVPDALVRQALEELHAPARESRLR